VIELRRKRWIRHVALMGDRKVLYRVWWEDLTEKEHFEKADVDGMIILKFAFKM